MFGINAQLQLQRPFECLEMANASVEQQTANNTFRFGDDALYPNDALTICLWTYGLSTAGGFNNLCGRETSTVNRNIELRIFFNAGGTNDIDFLTSSAGNNLQQCQASAGSQLSKEKWYFYAVTCDSTATPDKKIFLYDENRFITSGSTSTFGGIFSSANIAYQVGTTRDASGGVFSYQRQVSHGVWSGMKTDSFIRSIWNYGRGLQYDDLTADQKTNLVEWWNLNDWDGTDCTGNHATINLIRNTFGTTNISKQTLIP